jgi:hypothetical protein
MANEGIGAVSPQAKRAAVLAEGKAQASEDDLGVSAARQGQPGTVVGHTQSGRVIVIGRDGKPISRKGDSNIDKYAIPKEEIPLGWSYQWIAETVLNEPQTAALMDFQQKQWVPVPQSRHPTRPVKQGGLMLVERPEALTKEARQEEMQEARDQIRTNVEQFMPNDSGAARSGLRPTGGIRKGRAQSVAVDGVAPPTLELGE